MWILASSSAIAFEWSMLGVNRSMNAAESIALVAALAAIIAAAISFWQARSARESAYQAQRNAEAAERGASATEDQAAAVRAQVEIMRSSVELELAREQAEVQMNKIAQVVVWKETRQPRGGLGAVIVVENRGPHAADELLLQVVASGDGQTIDVLATEEARIARRPELHPHDRWKIPLANDAGNKLPLECSLRWRDGRETRNDVRVRVEVLGVDSID